MWLGRVEAERHERGQDQEMPLGAIDGAAGEDFMAHAVRNPSDVAAARPSRFAEARTDCRIMSIHGPIPIYERRRVRRVRHDVGRGSRPAMAAISSLSWTGKGKTMVLLRSLAMTLSVER